MTPTPSCLRRFLDTAFGGFSHAQAPAYRQQKNVLLKAIEAADERKQYVAYQQQSGAYENG